MRLLRRLISVSPSAFGVLVVISVVSNILMLTGPLFMLQVYDRVLVSRSVPTLLALSMLMVSMFALYAVIETLRSRMAVRYAGVVEDALGGPVIRATIGGREAGTEGEDVVGDLDRLRQFLGGSGAISFLDLPWVPLYLCLIFLFHPALGWIAIAGGAVMLVLLLANEYFSQGASRQLSGFAMRRQLIGRDLKLSSEPILAMGMVETMARRWQDASIEHMRAQIASQDNGALYSSVTKAFRLLLQSVVLAVGAYLAINGAMTAGLMIAASVITARALAPVEQAVAHWRSFVGARHSYSRIQAALKRHALIPAVATELALPRSDIELRRVSVALDNSQRRILSDIDFRLSSGDALGILGPSGSGKSTLARLVVGLVAPSTGEIRLDGSELRHFERDRLGRTIGYLPQDVDLFDGTIAENICRFRQDTSNEALFSAAHAANCHELIVAMPDGYDTRVGPRGRGLSGGQRQRIGLARALFGNPFLLVLDEPNSNLDGDGDEALTHALMMSRQRGSIVLVVAHRRNALSATNKLLILQGGQQVDFGLKEDVIDRLQTKQMAVPTWARTGTNG